MKLTKFFALALLCATCFSCLDENNELGSSVQPGVDQIEIKNDTLEFLSSTQKVEKIYTRSVAQWLGRLTSNFYGDITMGFMTQFVPAPEMNFGGDKNIGDRIDSMVMRIRYITFLGDSLAPLQMTVYKLSGNPQLPDMAYSDINPREYYDPTSDNLLGRKTYTASDINVADSIRENENYARTITMTLPKSFTDNFYKTFKEHPEVFKSQKEFNKFFPGVYISNSYGNGSIIDIRETTIRCFFKVQENDTTVKEKFEDYLAVTPEVTSVNCIKNINPSYMENESTDTSYIKTPAALYTEFIFPTQSIIDFVKNQGLEKTTLNGVNFKLASYVYKKNKLGISPPKYLLFIRSKDVESFFSTKSQQDNINTFTAAYSNGYYDFGNINSFVNNIITANPDTTVVNEKISIIPILFNSMSSTSSVMTISHALYPSLVKLKKEMNVSVLTVTRPN